MHFLETEYKNNSTKSAIYANDKKKERRKKILNVINNKKWKAYNLKVGWGK